MVESNAGNIKILNGFHPISDAEVGGAPNKISKFRHLCPLAIISHAAFSWLKVRWCPFSSGVQLNYLKSIILIEFIILSSIICVFEAINVLQTWKYRENTSAVLLTSDKCRLHTTFIIIMVVVALLMMPRLL